MITPPNAPPTKPDQVDPEQMMAAVFHELGKRLQLFVEVDTALDKQGTLRIKIGVLGVKHQDDVSLFALSKDTDGSTTAHAQALAREVARVIEETIRNALSPRAVPPFNSSPEQLRKQAGLDPEEIPSNEDHGWP